jgi:hypothetical protein
MIEKVILAAFFHRRNIILNDKRKKDIYFVSIRERILQHR